MLEYLAFRVLSLLAPVLPSGLGLWLCNRIGDLAYWALSRRRRNVRSNLSLVLGADSPDLERRVRQVFREGAKYYYDTFRTPALSDADLVRLVTIEGWEWLEQGLRAGKGVVMFSAHLGSPSIVAQLLRLRQYSIVTVVEPVQPQGLYDLMVKVRGSRGIRLIPFGPRSIRDLAEALRHNEIVGIVVDRDVARTGAPVQFFGREVSMSTGPVMLALRTGAALVPAFTYRKGNGRFLGRFWEPLEMERTGDLHRDLQVNTQKVARVVETAVRECPEQWVVFEPVLPEEVVGAGHGAAG